MFSASLLWSNTFFTPAAAQGQYYFSANKLPAQIFFEKYTPPYLYSCVNRRAENLANAAAMPVNYVWVSEGQKPFSIFAIAFQKSYPAINTRNSSRFIL